METELVCTVCGKSDDYCFFLKDETKSDESKNTFTALRLCEYHYEALRNQIRELEE